MEKFLVMSNMSLEPFSVRQYNSLALAFVGDAVHSMYVRARLVGTMNIKVNDLQKITASVVRASSQCDVIDKVFDTLEEDEKLLVKRARNTKTNNTPKSATAKEYQLSTAFEALVGYWYLTGQNEKMNEILELSFKGCIC